MGGFPQTVQGLCSGKVWVMHRFSTGKSEGILGVDCRYGPGYDGVLAWCEILLSATHSFDRFRGRGAAWGSWH